VHPSFETPCSERLLRDEVVPQLSFTPAVLRDLRPTSRFRPLMNTPNSADVIDIGATPCFAQLSFILGRVEGSC